MPQRESRQGSCREGEAIDRQLQCVANGMGLCDDVVTTIGWIIVLKHNIWCCVFAYQIVFAKVSSAVVMAFSGGIQSFSFHRESIYKMLNYLKSIKPSSGLLSSLCISLSSPLYVLRSTNDRYAADRTSLTDTITYMFFHLFTVLLQISASLQISMLLWSCWSYYVHTMFIIC